MKRVLGFGEEPFGTVVMFAESEERTTRIKLESRYLASCESPYCRKVIRALLRS